jgi:hypothetical protein
MRRWRERMEEGGTPRINILREVFSYMSCVEIYTDNAPLSDRNLTDMGPHLGDYGRPRRVAIQRRFIQQLIEFLQRDYDGWYVFAHSLGSVIALQGLLHLDEAYSSFSRPGQWFRDNTKI